MIEVHALRPSLIQKWEPFHLMLLNPVIDLDVLALIWFPSARRPGKEPETEHLLEAGPEDAGTASHP